MTTQDVLVKLSKDLLRAMEQKSFYSEGCVNGSASYSELRDASIKEHNAYSALWNFIKDNNL